MDDLEPPLPWHAPILEQIQSTLDQGRLPNAIALVCPSGWGLRPLSERAVQIIAELAPEQIPSGLAHQDIRWIEPDGAVLKVDQIRRINDFAVQTVQVASRKVALLWQAEKLNANAANALLKTLEEPPGNTHIVLATESWGRLLPTIRSRCQRWVVRPDRKAALAWLRAQGISVDEGLFAETGYAPFSYEADAATVTTMLAGMDSAAVTNLVRNDDIDTGLFLARWYRHLIGHAARALKDSDTERSEHLQGFAERVLDVRRQVLTSNAANETLLFEGLMHAYRKLADNRPQV